MYNYFQLIGTIEKIDNLKNNNQVTLKIKRDMIFSDGTALYDYPVVNVKHFEGEDTLLELGTKVAIRGNIEWDKANNVRLLGTKIAIFLPNGELEERALYGD